MKITQVSYERLDINLATPYIIAYETVAKATNFILKIETNTTTIGYGCAAPDSVVTGETPDQVETAIKTIIIPYLIGKNPFLTVKILEDLKLVMKGSSSALAMVDIALHDLISRKLNIPLYQFLGGYREYIATSITIGILSVTDTLKEATQFVEQGFNIIKVKGGLDVEQDIEKMIKIREKFPHVSLRFDGNQGYTVNDSVAFVKRTKTVDIEIFEQPLPIIKEEKLGEVTQQVTIPVMADESIKTLKDAFRLAQNQRIDMVNIKLMKVGGILEAKHISSVAKSANLDVMIGCIDECRLGISAGLHFALSRPNIHYADLDGHLDMSNDPFGELFTLKKGVLYPSTYPGLGKI
ncbi:mandelate racemase/muconate lactonizing enzyme family protein [Aquimarina sp. W85]|uniref:mandelate racemase/muconate lactonizing enzyme family protein n=1 Tax=Aquimarina rhodophyticola TaxID=3342246 RepID=UPI00366B6501